MSSKPFALTEDELKQVAELGGPRELKISCRQFNGIR